MPTEYIDLRVCQKKNEIIFRSKNVVDFTLLMHTWFCDGGHPFSRWTTEILTDNKDNSGQRPPQVVDLEHPVYDS